MEQQLKEIQDTKIHGNRDLNGPQQQDKLKAQVNFFQTRSRLDADQSVFRVYKGVKCFDFSKNKNIIVTGGMDRIVRMWNPYVPGLDIILNEFCINNY